MPKTVFLAPFSNEPSNPDLKIKVEVDLKEGSELSLSYRCEGNLDSILIAEPKPGSRADKLWEHTCFEAFFGIQGQDSYWELNLSPSGDWNLYHFDSYRSGMKREARIN